MSADFSRRQALERQDPQDFEPGLLIQTRGRTISEADVRAFATLTGDVSQLHMNEEYSRGTPYGRPIVHGALVFSLSVGLATETGLLDGILLAFSRVDHLRFVRPVFIGDTISVIKTLLAVEVRGLKQRLLVFDTRVRNERGEIVLAYVDKILIGRSASLAG